jgi:hypothetical protein
MKNRNILEKLIKIPSRRAWVGIFKVLFKRGESTSG